MKSITILITTQFVISLALGYASEKITFVIILLSTSELFIFIDLNLFLNIVAS